MTPPPRKTTAKRSVDTASRPNLRARTTPRFRAASVTPGRRRISGRRDLTWHNEGGVLVLRRGKRGSALARVIPDRCFQGMYRFVDSDGGESDMANLSRIKAAAIAFVLANLNSPANAQDSAGEAPHSDSMSGDVSSAVLGDPPLTGALKAYLANEVTRGLSPGLGRPVTGSESMRSAVAPETDSNVGQPARRLIVKGDRHG
jgi:hypothetical protein